MYGKGRHRLYIFIDKGQNILRDKISAHESRDQRRNIAHIDYDKLLENFMVNFGGMSRYYNIMSLNFAESTSLVYTC